VGGGIDDREGIGLEAGDVQPVTVGGKDQSPRIVSVVGRVEHDCGDLLVLAWGGPISLRWCATKHPYRPGLPLAHIDGMPVGGLGHPVVQGVVLHPGGLLRGGVNDGEKPLLRSVVMLDGRSRVVVVAFGRHVEASTVP
jgi:hypothetical protein